MNSQNTDNKTDLQTAVIPCMAMKIGNTEVNRMYGYAQDMDESYMRDTLTPVGTDKTLAVSITPYGRKIESLVYEIRTADGSKVVENNKIKNFQEEADGKLTAEFTLQKSILMNQEYSLSFTLNTEAGSWTYYTRLIQRAGLSTDKYIDFVNSFYTKSLMQEDNGDLLPIILLLKMKTAKWSGIRWMSFTVCGMTRRECVFWISNARPKKC